MKFLTYNGNETYMTDCHANVMKYREKAIKWYLFKHFLLVTMDSGRVAKAYM